MVNMLGSGGSLSRVPSRWLLLGAAAVAVLGGVGLAALLRTFPSSPVAFEVVVENNLDSTVLLGHCIGSDGDPICDVTEPDIRLPVGEYFTTLSGPGSSNPFVVRAPDGQILGCLPLAFTKAPESRPTVYTSEAGWCGGYLSQ